MSRRFKTKGRVGVGQDSGDMVTVPLAWAQQMAQGGYIDPSSLSDYYTGNRPGTAPAQQTGTIGGNPTGGPLEVPLGRDPVEAQFALQNLKNQQELQYLQQSGSQRSQEQSQSFQQSQQLQNEKFNQAMAELAAKQASQDNPFSGLAPKYTAPNAITGPNGAVSMFDPGTGQLMPVFQPSQDVKISGGNLIVPPGQQAQVYYAGNKGQPTNVSGGPGQVNYPQQLPFSALQQAQAVAPMIQQYAQQNRQQQGGMGGYGGGMSGAMAGAGGVGASGGLGGAAGGAGGFGRAFGQQGVSPYGQMGSQFGRTFGNMMPQVPSTPQIPPQPPAQGGFQFPQDMVDYTIADLGVQNMFGLPYDPNAGGD